MSQHISQIRYDLEGNQLTQNSSRGLAACRMGPQTNFGNFADVPAAERSTERQPGIPPLSRQPSVYALTFNEFQSTWGGLTKDFGSINMDELLKNIWTAEDSQLQLQATAPSIIGGEGGGQVGNLLRKGSLTLSRTLSQKTVDEVWRDLFKETEDVKEGSGGRGDINLPQRQRTLGEMTLEEFLVRAGIVREGTQMMARPSDNGFHGEISRFTSNGLTSSVAAGNNDIFFSKPAGSPLDFIGTRPSQLQQQPQPQPLEPPASLFPKPENVPFASSVHLANTAHIASPGSRDTIGIAHSSLNKTFVHSDAIQAGGHLGQTGFAVGSPANLVSPDAISNNSADVSSLSPVPYAFGRGRKSKDVLEKAVERRHKRMIKNRESAARSRARKQAYNLELEAEIARLKKINQELLRKQAEVKEMQKDQISQKANGLYWENKRQCCLRRTLTGPW
ncbi:bZIP transcription factor 46-like isoform X2 [Syzygium oleosum]|uniref:bZIP transcription factor 46-like isoform X2 n=1 Tax=Syzygium oleosum TaxID=219896 RepID=UPI0011D1A8A4|nr:bZIP transcription factor 46-like isoform X2 [Syzygium oleosum]